MTRQRWCRLGRSRGRGAGKLTQARIVQEPGGPDPGEQVSEDHVAEEALRLDMRPDRL